VTTKFTVFRDVTPYNFVDVNPCFNRDVCYGTWRRLFKTRVERRREGGGDAGISLWRERVGGSPMGCLTQYPWRRILRPLLLPELRPQKKVSFEYAFKKRSTNIKYSVI
jgi:hypothetical protein